MSVAAHTIADTCNTIFLKKKTSKPVQALYIGTLMLMLDITIHIKTVSDKILDFKSNLNQFFPCRCQKCKVIGECEYYIEGLVFLKKSGRKTT